MARFVLREFSTPDYRGSLPGRDPNNAIWPRISALGKMLHDMSWEDKGAYDDGTGRTEEQREADFRNDARENVKTVEDKKMEGYSEYLNRLHNDPRVAAELHDEGETQNYADRASSRNGGGYNRGGDMERQRALAEGTAERREPGTWTSEKSPEKVKSEQIAEIFPNANMEDVGTFFPDVFVETEESKKAMQDYLDQLDWENAENAFQAEKRAEYAGYKPLGSMR